ncbi:MAG: DUF4838 domain-containing protein [Verrucomicrobiota bacterium]
MFQKSDPLLIVHGEIQGRPCYRYAVEELQRILRRLGFAVQGVQSSLAFHHTTLMVTQKGGALKKSSKSGVNGVRDDGYSIQVLDHEILLGAVQEKGILNAVYDLAERWGFVFLLPGEEGEWAPEKMAPLKKGRSVQNPRFPYRGVFWESLEKYVQDYSVEEWLKFYAKLRFNALSHKIEDQPLAEQLGLRLEVGGHGLSQLMPRDLYEKNPEYFRMFQPEDFGGKRLKDSNLCVTNPRAKQVLQSNFRKELKKTEGVHAFHAWGDDLPSGGWCLCSSCRSFSPTDQALLAMGHLSEVAKEFKVRIPVLAYHDTMFPGDQIKASREAFLLFAPRERCYGHALDDSSCPRNRWYLQALKAWEKKFKGINDSHTFEYYFDQILFRGVYPFLPGIILEDMKTYLEHGIECHFALQVAGPAIAPEYNMLVFAKAHWNEGLTENQFIRDLAKAMAPKNSQTWSAYLRERAAIFTSAMRFCGHDTGGYMDYRWLPETTQPFGREITQIYHRSSKELMSSVQKFKKKIKASGSDREKILAKKEILRGEFEAAELKGMAFQQSAVCALAQYHNGGGTPMLKKALGDFRKAVRFLKEARQRANRAGLSEGSWYCAHINSWIRSELEKKISLYEPFCKKTTNFT